MVLLKASMRERVGAGLLISRIRALLLKGEQVIAAGGPQALEVHLCPLRHFTISLLLLFVNFLLAL